MYASPFDNYWVVADQAPNTLWSSSAVAYVADTDATYLAWIAAGFEASYIDTEAELADLLNETYPAGSPIPAPPASTAGLGPMQVDIIVATTLLAELGQAIGGIEAIELIEGDREPASIEPLAAGADTTGSYTVPAGVYKLIIFGQAAGGASGNCTAAASQVGGGGGSGETRCAVLAVQPGQVIDYVIGGRGLANGGTASDLTIGGSAAAFPVIIGSKAKAEGPSSLTHTVTLPTGIAAGDLLVMFLECQLGTITTPAGWTIGYNTTFTTAAGASRAEMFWKIADGSEGTSVTLTTSLNVALRSIVHRITGHDPATPQVNAVATGSSVSPNPPNVALAGGLAKAALWIAACHNEQNITAYPSTFGNPLTDPSLEKALGTANLNSNVSALDPPVFTISAGDGWAAGTVAIYPATPASLMRCKGGTGGGTASGGANGASGTTPTGSGGVRIPPTGVPFGVAAASVYSRGGSSWFGHGGANLRTTTMPGLDGQGPGAGASGAGNATGTTAQAGADGAPGMILIFGFGK